MNFRWLVPTAAVLVALCSHSASQAAVPVVTTFATVASSNSPVRVTAFTATDSDGSVVGYMCTDNNTKPSASSPNWSPIAPTSCSTSRSGSVVLYGWAKDNANGVSNGKAFTTWVPGVHAHVIADVTNLQSELDGKAPLAHDHDALYQRRYDKVAVVASTGGNYGSPVDAMNDIATWCGVPSAENPCLVKIMPGIYDLGPSAINMREYVDIEGSGENITKITGSVSTTYGGQVGVVNLAANAELRSLTVENAGPGSQDTSIAISCPTTAGWSRKISDVTVIARNGAHHTIGIWNDSWLLTVNGLTIQVSGAATADDDTAQGISNGNYGGGSGLRMRDSTIDVTGPGGAVYGVTTRWNEGITISDSRVTTTGGPVENNAINIICYSTLELTNVTASSSSIAVHTFSFGRPMTIERSTLVGTAYSIQHNNQGEMKVGASQLNGPVTGMVKCVGAYDGNYNPLTANCQP